MERFVGLAAANKRMAAAIVLSIGLHFAGLYELRLPFGRVAPPSPLTVTLEGVESLPAPGPEEKKPPETGEEFAPLEPSIPSLPPFPVPSPPPPPENFGFPPPPQPPEITGVGPEGLPSAGEEKPPAGPEGELPEIGEPVCEFEATIRPDGIEPLKPVEGGAKPPKGLEPPEPLLALMPPYPEEAVEKGLQGRVVVDILVGENGKPLRANVTGEKRLEPLARPILDAVRNWRFKPAKRDGKPVKAAVRVDFLFSLGGGAPPAPVVAIAPPKEGEKPKVEGKEIEVAAEYLGIITPTLIRPLFEVKPKAPAEKAEVSPPKPLFPLMPPYPKDAVEAGEEGEVVIYVLVDENGEPKRAAVEATGVPISLMRAALEAVSTWRFEPAKREGRPVEAWVKIRLEFAKEVEKGGKGSEESIPAKAEASQGAEGPPQKGGEATRPSGPVPRPGGEAGAQGEGGPGG